MIDNPLVQKLGNHTIILASGSPRRQQFFKDLGLEVEIRLQDVDEVYPETLKGQEISAFLAELKATPFKENLASHEIVITSDTVVWHKGESLAKAADEAEAKHMLQKLSGAWHEVITSVCFTTSVEQRLVNAVTKVKFAVLSEEEIAYYLQKCKPYDKAGAYGIQEWIGAIAIERIEGSYNTVVGLPTHLVYKTLMDMVS